MNNVALIGRLTRDPELRYIPSGTAVTKFTLAIDKGYSRDKKIEMTAENKPTADFINIVAFGTIAEVIANYTSKGKQIGISGRIQTSNYEKDGKRVYTTDVVASAINILEWDKKDDIPEGFHPTENNNIPF